MRLMIHHVRALSAIAGLMLAAAAASAQAAQSGNSNSSKTDPNFSSRTENPDGSVAFSIGQRLPTEWEMKIGTDVSLIGSDSGSGSQSVPPGTPPGQSTGTVWSNITIPGAARIWDKTTIEARVDPMQDHGKLGATLSRSVSLGHDVSVTLQNSYSVARPLAEHPLAATTATATVIAVGSLPPTSPPSSRYPDMDG
jgi:hypothetical protein